MYGRRLKRVIDVVVASTALLVLLPTLALIPIAIRIHLGSPVFFKQPRPGRQGRPFKIVKFRTMRDGRDPDGRLLPDAARLTRLGAFLRSTSLDELPELWNVARGEMSLVGPRPLLVEYLDRYTPTQARRHDLRPGMTGLAQVNGRNALTWEQKFAFDVDYVERCSLRLDLGILLRTWRIVFARTGINQPGQATMEKFLGSALQ
jgi:lipopolysaccharide/colanic/teichoic acid biosynthesis glycosyltransferase